MLLEHNEINKQINISLVLSILGYKSTVFNLKQQKSFFKTTKGHQIEKAD